LALSAVAVVEVCAYATPVINAVLNNAIAIYFDFMVSSIVSRYNTGCSAWFHWLERGVPDAMCETTPYAWQFWIGRNRAPTKVELTQ
jgi:hypothetical protein